MRLQDLAGQTLGTRTVAYGPRDAALYALAVGARADQLDLVYERDLRPLPTFVTALGIWGTEAAADAGGYDPAYVLHAGQTLLLKKPLAAAGELAMTARVADVHDKGKAAIVDVRVESSHFEAGYQMYVKGVGGWGGNRGPSSTVPPAEALLPASQFRVDERAAALYRLTGDLHPIHIDPELARTAGHRGPILHGLCTLGIAVREVAEARGRSALDVRTLEARLQAPVYPRDLVRVAATPTPSDRGFGISATVGDTSALTGWVGLHSPSGNGQ